jgi:DNA-directed RNA polymerase specialized sigma24 family protein
MEDPVKNGVNLPGERKFVRISPQTTEGQNIIENIYNKWHGYLHASCMGKLRAKQFNHNDIHDVASFIISEYFISLMSASSVPDISVDEQVLKNFLLNGLDMSINNYIKFHKRQKRIPRWMEKGIDFVDSDSEQGGKFFPHLSVPTEAEANIIKEELDFKQKEKIKKALSFLPNELRELVELRLMGHNTPEIAKILQKRTDFIRMKLALAYRMLRPYLEK